MPHLPDSPETIVALAREILSRVHAETVDRQPGQRFRLRGAWSRASQTIMEDREPPLHPWQAGGVIHLAGGYAMAMVLLERAADALTPNVPAGHAAHEYASEDAALSVAVADSALATLDSDGARLALDFVGPTITRTI